ncbi:MAG: cystathionine gamma-synthase family protein [Pyrobaculum sp.]
MRRGTVPVRGYKNPDPYGSLQPPIYQTAVFKMEGEALKSDRGFDLKYSREENPTLRPLEEILTKLEMGVDALAFNSGMAALSTVFLALLKAGGSILAPMESYGATLRLLAALEKYNVRLRKAYPDTEIFIEELKASKPTVAFFETITNPNLKVFDVPEVIKAARDLEAWVVVDNTFATPVLITPIAHGADLVVHSTSKYLAGHNDVIGGAVVAASRELVEELWLWRAMLGTIMQPFEAYLTLRGVKTLGVRFEQQCKNAMAVAEFLIEHSKVAEVIYPGLSTHPHHHIARKLFGGRYGAVVSFKIRGGQEAAIRFFKSLKIITPSPSLGGVESIATYPITSAASPIADDEKRLLGITGELIRLSVGIEDPQDLVEDLDQALKKA